MYGTAGFFFTPFRFVIRISLTLLHKAIQLAELKTAI